MSLAFVAVAVLGFSLRVVYPGVVDLDDDLSERIVSSRRIVAGEHRPLLGRELSGLLDRGRHGPAMEYIEAVPFLVSRSPLAIPWWVSLLHVAGIWALYRLGREISSPYAGLLAALAMACSPFLLYWTRRTMNPSYLVFWMPLIYLLGWRVLTVARSRAWVALGFSFALASQFHLLVVNVLPAAALLFPALRPRIAWRWLVGGVLAGLLVYSPLVIAGFAYESWDHVLGFGDLLRGDLGQGPRVWSHFLEPVRNLYNRSLLVSFLPGGVEWRAETRYLLGGRIMAGTVLAGATLLVLWLPLATLRARRRKQRVPEAWKGVVFILVLTGVQSALLANIRTDFYPRYVVPILPLLYLTLAVGFDRLAIELQARRALAFIVRGTGLALVLASVALQLPLELGVLAELSRSGTMAGGRPTTGVQTQIAEILVADLGFRGHDDVHGRLRSSTGKTYGLSALVDLRATAPRTTRNPRMVLLGPAAQLPVQEGRPELERFDIAEFALVAFEQTVDPLEVALAVRPEGHWFDPGYDDTTWRRWDSAHYGVAEEEIAAMRIPVVIESSDAALEFTLWSRACVERAWLDGALIRSTPCSRERSTEEVDRSRTRISIGILAPGRHLLALELVIRDKWYDLRFQAHPPGLEADPP